ncbi:MAG: hypothetical protein HY840_05750 [Bacteroidetes bacterium]|nr:hypothetical protein [Bacteroidota bacterium]
MGATNFLGDLGGADQIGTHAFKDFEYVLTRTALSFGMRYKFGKFFTVKNNLYWATLRGDDKLTKEPFRNNRNINFRSPIWELSTQLEFNFIKEQTGHVYKIRGVRGMQHRDRQVYVFGGGGLFYFNPKGYWNGKWYPLEPLHTEGISYSRINYLISVGSGFRLALNRYWGIGLELGLRYTFTDYIDDVSTTYQDPSTFNGNPVAIHFANPSLADRPSGAWGCQTCIGEERGDHTHKDSYMFGTITVGYKVMYRKRSRSKF